jgi:hypothetical protein
MIVIALVLFLIGMLIWKKCFSPSQSMEASPPAPSAPPMPAPNQPHDHLAQPATNNQATKSNAQRKGEILEQYSERHPTTNFNKTPSTKHILL